MMNKTEVCLPILFIIVLILILVLVFVLSTSKFALIFGKMLILVLASLICRIVSHLSKSIALASCINI